METKPALLVILSLLSCLPDALSSNPDSVDVQSSSDNSDKSVEERSSPLLNAESQGNSASSDTQRYHPPVPPIISDDRTARRKIVSYTSYIAFGRPVGTFFSQSHDSRRYRPDHVFPADELTTVAKEEAATNRPKDGSIPGVSFPKETEFNQRNDDRKLDSSSSGGPRSRGGSKNEPEEFPNGSNYGNHNGDQRPTAEPVPTDFDGDTRGENGRERTNHRPVPLNPSSSSGQGGRGTSYDGSYRQPSAGERVPSDSRPDTSGQGGRGTSYDGSYGQPSAGERGPSDSRPDTSGQGGRGTSNDGSFRPASSDNSSSNNFDPNASSHPVDSEGDFNSKEHSNSPTTRPPPPLNECTAKRKTSRDANFLSGVINNFAFKLVDLMKLETNFVVSPLSIFVALSMCYLGSATATKSELETALGLNGNSVRDVELHKGIKRLLSLVLPRSGEYDLNIANGMFLGRNFTVYEDFERHMQSFYKADLKNVDFQNPEQTMPVINEWVSRATKNMITSLTNNIPSPLTRLLLANAMYFKGIWKTQFPPNKTSDNRFTTSDGNTIMVPTMPLYGETFPFLKSAEHRHSFLKLPYQGDQVSMIIALPYTSEGKPMPDVTNEILCGVRDAMANTLLDTVTIPKFKLEYTKSLVRPLEHLGISRLFSPSEKDLSNMRKENDVSVSDILHKAVIDVSERGTTASATTSAHIVPLVLENTTDFEADHPFAFYVVHEPSGLVLFYGKFYGTGGTSDSFSNIRKPVLGTRPPSSSPREPPKNSRVPSRGSVAYENKK